ncbi:cytochrome P450 4c3-like [Phymastichus coffea]|uniref:cytochrome P450 4c3-like n=1 Tax=Phymastichus coffea TaxID=108790 RepID=UPI00273B6D83|nr:cytochrome P450 4c3-like [Phymastichus coffea]
MFASICLVIVLLSLLALHVSARYGKAGRTFNKIPGPPPLPFVGNWLMFSLSSEKIWDKILQLLDEYYPIVRIWKGYSLGIFIRHPDDMKAIMSCKKNINKCHTIYSIFQKLNNEGLIVSGGKKWRQRRKMITPAFSPNILQVYTEIANEYAEQLIQTIKSQNIEIIPDLLSIGLKYAIGVVCGERKRLSVLDLLLAAELNNLIDEKGLKEEVETFIVTGYESTGVALTFTLMLLAENKTAQELARCEAVGLLSQTDGVLTVADINKLEYIERCIKEALRLYPSAPMIGRIITEDIKLSDEFDSAVHSSNKSTKQLDVSGNYEIPIGTEVVMNIFAAHRDPNFWPDPDKFDPDRFLPENTKERHPFAYVPFSAGLRMCMAYRFATLELKLVVARILSHFVLEPVDLTADVKFKLHVALKPKNPCRIKLIKINRQ